MGKEPMTRAEFRAEFERAFSSVVDKHDTGRFRDAELEKARAQSIRALADAAKAWLELTNDEDYDELRGEIRTAEEVLVEQ